MACPPSLRATMTLLAGSAAALALVATAAAQNSQLDPTFGTISQSAGFGSASLTIQAGGDLNAFDFSSACNGFIADAPDVTIDYSGGQSLSVAATSEADTTLVVQLPGGSILCNDDLNGLNPGLDIPAGQSGPIAVWVGTFEPIQNNTYPDADVTVSESGGGTATTQPGTTQPGTATSGQSSTFGEIAVTPGFGTQTFSLQAGGSVDAFTRNSNCNGFIAEIPDYTISFQDAGASALDIAVTSTEDTTLFVTDPAGGVFCNDDAVDLNPGVTISSPRTGIYSVWVGTFNAIANDFFPDAQMTVSTQGSGTPTQPGGTIRVQPQQAGDLAARLRLPPTFGSTQLADGFGGHTIDFQAGGGMDAASFGPSCNGFVAEAPDYVVNYAGQQALRITATSAEDTTMVVVAPDGQVLCNDDFSQLNPGLIAPENLPGQYAIWIGTYTPIQNDFYPDANLLVEEVSMTKVHPSGAVTSMSLTAGFTPDPFTTVIAAGGPINAGSFGPGCNGSIASSPDFVLSYTSGDYPLRVFVNSDADTTLLMRTPTGEVLCNDDADGLNPEVVLTDPVSGQYEIFVGTFDSSAGNPEATLAISEIVDQKILPDGAVRETTINQGSFRQEFELLAGGSFEAAAGFGGSCNGFIAGNADFITYVDSAGIDVEMTVRSAEDTTLVVRGPDGTVYCDDDSGGDFNPLLLIAGAQSGPYEVWLGTFSSVGNAPATLSVGDANAGGGTAPNLPGGGKK